MLIGDRPAVKVVGTVAPVEAIEQAGDKAPIRYDKYFRQLRCLPMRRLVAACLGGPLL
jgi:hypothetical protein